MKQNYRLSKGTTEYYTSLEDLRKGWGLPELRKKTKDEKKLKGQQERFVSRHKCKACGSPMEHVTGNIMACTNKDCLGIKTEKTDKEGNIIVTYLTSFDLLDDTGAIIAENIFH